MRIARTAAAFLLVGLAIATAAPAAAQADAPIIVTGQKDIEKQVESFIGALTPTGPRAQIARFENEICPRAVGFTEPQRLALEERIRLVAGGVGLKVGDVADCRINLLIVAAPDKVAFVKSLGRKHAYMFGDQSPAEVRRILAQPGSAIAWQVEGMLNADGHPVMLTQGIPVNRTTHAGSRITAPARTYIAGAVVVFDSKGLEGLTIMQVADYALMRSFSKVDVARLDKTSAPTILRALDAGADEEVPVTLTQWDFAFLKGLYSGANNLYAPSQKSDIRREIEKIGEPDKGDEPASAQPKG